MLDLDPTALTDVADGILLDEARHLGLQSHLPGRPVRPALPAL